MENFHIGLEGWKRKNVYWHYVTIIPMAVAVMAVFRSDEIGPPQRLLR